MKKKILFILVLLIPIVALSQTATLKGVVKDDAGTLVPNILVKIQGIVLVKVSTPLF